MNYRKIYDDLIYKRTAVQRLSECTDGCEIHHIIPISEGGLDEKSNLVRLTVKEHIFVHQLLARIYNTPNMWCAAHLMMCTRNNKKRSLRLAVIARRKMSESKKRENLSLETRKLMRESKLGAKNNFYGRHHTNETKKKISLSHLGKPGYWKDRHLSIETKRKLSKAKLGKPIPKLRGIIRTQECCQKMMYAQNTRKKIVQMDDNDTIIQKFESIREAERKTKISRRCISWCLNGEQKHAGGFVWKYER